MIRLKLFRSRLALFGSIMSLIVVIVALTGSIIAPYGASEFSDDLLCPPSRAHYLGTDHHGRDVYSRILRGCSTTLSLAITTICFAGAVGILWGLMAAYTKGLVSDLLSRAIDIVMSITSIMIALHVLAIV